MVLNKKLWTSLYVLMAIACIIIPLFIIVPVYSEEQPKYGGTLVIAISTDPSPHLVACHSHSVPAYMVGNSICLPLFHYDLEQKPVGDLAESYEWSSDNMSLIVYLRKNVKWHDGENFTSADVKYTYENLLFKYNPYGKIIAPYIDHIDDSDPYKVVFVLKQPFTPLQWYLYFPIAPKHIYEGTDPTTNPNNWAPIGTGPFKFKEWVKGDHITLVKNEEYFEEGKPYLDEIIFKIIPDAATRSLSLLAGEVDAIFWYGFPLSHIEHFRSDPSLKVVVGGQDVPILWASNYMVWINLRNPILNNTKVRHALQHAINKTFIWEAACFKTGTVSKGPIPAYFWAYNPKIDEMQYEYDPDLAEQLLDEAGYPRKEDGWRFTLRFPVNTAVAERARICEIIAAQLREVGINVQLEMMEEGAWNERVVNWDFDLAAEGLTAGPHPLVATPRLYASWGIGHTTAANLGGYNNSEVDRLYKLAANETDPEKVKLYLYEIQEILVRDSPYLWIWNYPYPYAFKKEFHGIPMGSQGYEPLTNVWWEGGTSPTTTPTFPIEWVAVAVTAVAIIIVASVLWIKKVRKPKIESKTS